MASGGTNRGESSPLEGLLGYQLRRASSAVMADFAQGLARVELKPSEASVLLLIENQPHATQSEIGRVLGIKRANMAPLVASLDKPALLERGDQRRHEARTAVEANEARFFGRLSLPQREQLAALLAALRG